MCVCERVNTPPFACSLLTPFVHFVSFQSAQLEELLLVNERARPKLRILCLHGYLQNSQVSKRKEESAELCVYHLCIVSLLIPRTRRSIPASLTAILNPSLLTCLAKKARIKEDKEDRHPAGGGGGSRRYWVGTNSFLRGSKSGRKCVLRVTPHLSHVPLIEVYLHVLFYVDTGY